ncbi:DUF6183 family protein [Streptomyces parvulus]|uniref:DUF6183 family protein n=1 Tax=Streptomyces parvulus TaxID=146923 RepID=UPI0037898D7F
MPVFSESSRWSAPGVVAAPWRPTPRSCVSWDTHWLGCPARDSTSSTGSPFASGGWGRSRPRSSSGRVSRRLPRPTAAPSRAARPLTPRTTDGRTRWPDRSRPADWAREPEARFFTLPSPLGPDDFGISFIKELPLRALTGEGSRRGAALACVTTPDDVLNELFSAAYAGGVNGQGQGGAYARLFAWESFYALLGLPTCVPLLEAVRCAADHRWLRFMAFTDWFHHDTSDLAFAVLDPTWTRVAVLAATDTDVHRDALG